MQDDDGHPIILQGPPSLASPKHKKGTGGVDSGEVGLGIGVVHRRKNSFDGSSKKGNPRDQDHVPVSALLLPRLIELLSSARLGPLPNRNLNERKCRKIAVPFLIRKHRLPLAEVSISGYSIREDHRHGLRLLLFVAVARRMLWVEKQLTSEANLGQRRRKNQTC
ncbi:hypothetical protein DL96DRAFT_885001 [Flagelloscypha sp. PMI_526]|nr:hypothetical protein DL96DRAFT_885001 [Flagelloscypha sp. PMI_526]